LSYLKLESKRTNSLNLSIYNLGTSTTSSAKRDNNKIDSCYLSTNSKWNNKILKSQTKKILNITVEDL
jgi:hypothetical protein